MSDDEESDMRDPNAKTVVNHEMFEGRQRSSEASPACGNCGHTKLDHHGYRHRCMACACELFSPRTKTDDAIDGMRAGDARRPDLADDVIAVLTKWLDGDELYPEPDARNALTDAISEVRRQQSMHERLRSEAAPLTPEQAAEVERDVADLANLDMYRKLNGIQGEALIHIASVLPEPHMGTGDPRDLAKDVERQFGKRASAEDQPLEGEVDDIVAKHWGQPTTGHQLGLVNELTAMVRRRENQMLADGYDAAKRKEVGTITRESVLLGAVKRMTPEQRAAYVSCASPLTAGAVVAMVEPVSAEASPRFQIAPELGDVWRCEGHGSPSCSICAIDAMNAQHALRRTIGEVAARLSRESAAAEAPAEHLKPLYEPGEMVHVVTGQHKGKSAIVVAPEWHTDGLWIYRLDGYEGFTSEGCLRRESAQATGDRAPAAGPPNPDTCFHRWSGRDGFKRCVDCGSETLNPKHGVEAPARNAGLAFAEGARVHIVDGLSVGGRGTIVRADGVGFWLVDIDGTRQRRVRGDFLAPFDESGPSSRAAVAPFVTSAGLIVHRLKTHTRFFVDIIEDRKTFEIRKNDRGFRVGDILILDEWNPGTGYTNAYTTWQVTYLVQGVAGLPPDICVMGIRPGSIGNEFPTRDDRAADGSSASGNEQKRPDST